MSDFVRLQVTFDVKLYTGRMDPPYHGDDTWLLFLKDAFTSSWVKHDMLRPGEYIVVKNVNVLPPE